MTSMAEVARAAGVSQTTVSHVISGKRRVSAELTKAVRDAMKDLGYTPSRAAQNLARGSSRMIALVVPDISNSFFADLAKGVESAAREAGYNTLLANTGFDHANEKSYLEVIASRTVDGVVYAAGRPPKPEELHRMLGVIPAVLVDEDIPGTDLDVVVSDNELGGLLVAEHLMDLGHRCALVIDSPHAPTSDHLRVKGFTDRWNQNERESWRVHGDFTLESGATAIREALPLIEQHGVTAVFATNDLMALGAMIALEALGFEIPWHVSVVGYDNSFASLISGPSLTTVAQPVGEMGRVAIDKLMTRLSEPSAAPTSVVLPVRLVRRSSSAPALTPENYREIQRRKQER